VARRLSERARAQAGESQAGEARIDAPGLTTMVDALRGMMDQLADAAGDGKASMVFGYTIRMGADGVSAERFGDVPETPPAAAAPPARQPITEIHQEDGFIIVVAELPGADPDSITCRADGRTLFIAAGGARRYRKDVALPAAVRGTDMRHSFRHGILEVRLALADTTA